MNEEVEEHSSITASERPLNRVSHIRTKKRWWNIRRRQMNSRNKRRSRRRRTKIRKNTD